MLEFIALIKSIAALLGIGNVDIFIEITVANSVGFLGNTESLSEDFAVLLPAPEEQVNLKK